MYYKMTDNSIITIVTLNKEFVTLAKKKFKYVHNMLIQDYKPQRKTVFYVSPANSLGFMDGGIDKPLSTIMFSGVEKLVKQRFNIVGKTNKIGQKYLPIGSSVIIKPIPEDIFIPHLKERNCYLVSSPTMLMPQRVANTQNCYYATIATLYNIFINSGFRNCEVVFTSMCCGYGYMSVKKSLDQFTRACADFQNYKPSIQKPFDIIHEPNLDEQPNYYENTAFKDIKPQDIQDHNNGVSFDDIKRVDKTMG